MNQTLRPNPHPGWHRRWFPKQTHFQAKNRLSLWVMSQFQGRPGRFNVPMFLRREFAESTAVSPYRRMHRLTTPRNPTRSCRVKPGKPLFFAPRTNNINSPAPLEHGPQLDTTMNEPRPAGGARLCEPQQDRRFNVFRFHSSALRFAHRAAGYRPALRLAASSCARFRRPQLNIFHLLWLRLLPCWVHPWFNPSR